MSITWNTRALVLRREKWREADKKVVLYTRHFGKVEALAIGAAKITSKLSGHLEPLREIDVMLAKGKNIDKVAQAVTREDFLKNSSRFEVYWYSQEAARLVDKITKPGQTDPLLFNFLGQFFRFFKEARSGEEALKIWCAFCLKFLTILGYRPELESCGKCGKLITPANYFVFLNNHLVCHACQSGREPRLILPLKIISASRDILKNQFEKVFQLAFSAKELKLWRNWLKILTSNVID